jgi:phytoene dehydrogenase-like protein
MLNFLLPLGAVWYDKAAALHPVAKAGAVLLLLVLLLVAWITCSWPKPRAAEFQRADHFHPDRLPKKKIDTIVIGSGIGGSTCANLLAQSGQVVLVLEQHEVTGGCTHSFREKGCEWDTGLHYVGKAMCTPTARPGAIMDFMSRGLQKWTALPDDEPYDEVVFPVTSDQQVKAGAPNSSSYCFYAGAKRTTDAIVERIAADPSEAETLRKRVTTWMNLCTEINEGFVALGVSHLLPPWLQFLVNKKKEDLFALASLTVRNVQHAVFALGYDRDDILKNCPPAVDEQKGTSRMLNCRAGLFGISV